MDAASLCCELEEAICSAQPLICDREMSIEVRPIYSTAKCIWSYDEDERDSAQPVAPWTRDHLPASACCHAVGKIVEVGCCEMVSVSLVSLLPARNETVPVVTDCSEKRLQTKP